MSVFLTTAVAVSGFILALIAFAWQLVTYFKERRPVVFLDLTCRHEPIADAQHFVVTVRVRNNGKAEFSIAHAQLFVDQPQIVNGILEFPPITDYEPGHADCRLSEHCSRNAECRYPLELLPEDVRSSAGYSACFDLPYLAGQMKYIEGTQQIDDSRIVTVPDAGFYRITCVVIPKSASCMCKSIIATVPQDAAAEEVP